jgi:hypothetical protein
MKSLGRMSGLRRLNQPDPCPKHCSICLGSPRPDKSSRHTPCAVRKMTTSFPLRHTECADDYKRRARVPVLHSRGRSTC